MPKRIISQRRGKGSNVFTATKKAVADSKYINMDEKQETAVINGCIAELLNDPARTAVVAKIIFENGIAEYVVAAEGMAVGSTVQYGKDAEISIGNVSMLKYLPEGCPVFNVEKTPGDGGVFIRSSGSYGTIISKDEKNACLKLPSGKTAAVKLACRATIGCAAGGGQGEKPFIKAGARFHAMKARKKYYPIVRGVAMNPNSHPFGGSQHHAGHSKSVSRHKPAGAKVGAIASKRTGRKKKK